MGQTLVHAIFKHCNLFYSKLQTAYRDQCLIRETDNHVFEPEFGGNDWAVMEENNWQIQFYVRRVGHHHFWVQWICYPWDFGQTSRFSRLLEFKCRKYISTVYASCKADPHLIPAWVALHAQPLTTRSACCLIPGLHSRIMWEPAAEPSEYPNNPNLA